MVTIYLDTQRVVVGGWIHKKSYFSPSWKKRELIKFYIFTKGNVKYCCWMWSFFLHGILNLFKSSSIRCCSRQQDHPVVGLCITISVVSLSHLVSTEPCWRASSCCSPPLVYVCSVWIGWADNKQEADWVRGRCLSKADNCFPYLCWRE